MFFFGIYSLLDGGGVVCFELVLIGIGVERVFREEVLLVVFVGVVGGESGILLGFLILFV